MTGATCERCGAPWDPDVGGACRFCRAPARDAPPGAVDAYGLERALAARLRASDPLAALAADLGPCVGPALDVHRSRRGAVVSIRLVVGDWRLSLTAPLLEGEAQHVVRGITLKREPLTGEEWVARAAAALADQAGRDAGLRHALVELG